ncbi:hypothetical protein OOT46_19515 [Aquabacterium sp. A7-Y]|uniref:hypothetical protein n=1 Tax=Aquabacterium sp. A7-Y TaxID=1349605 RepID=UPI00223E8C15|nr:hypothetical protein [Aquabacterium sp. A7-Y]MCW7540029.1 hypothetical protein [Aquabacterium sp. A7-Y]
MNPWTGWALALAALAVGWYGYGWQGVVLAVSIIVFWLLLQFNKAVRVMRQAGSAPIGYIDSAVMLNAKMHTGMRMMQLVLLARSLGEKLGEAPERYRWTDPGGSHLTVEVKGGKVVSWELWRPQDPTAGA